jgi:hypothetical protein
MYVCVYVCMCVCVYVYVYVCVCVCVCVAVQQCPDKFRLQFQALFRELFQCEDLSQLHLQEAGPVETMLPVIYHARIQVRP